MAEQEYPQTSKFFENRQSPDRVPASELSIPPEFLPLAERLEGLTQTWNPVEFVTASSTSIKKEQATLFENFKAGTEYNPTFEYPRLDTLNLDVEAVHAELRAMLNEVRKFKPSNEQERIAKVTFYYKIRDDLATVMLIRGMQNKDEDLIRRAMNVKYASLDDSLLATAHQFYSELTSTQKTETQPEPTLLTTEQQSTLKTHELDAQGIKEAFEWVLNKYGILRTENDDPSKGFTVVITDEVTGIDVRDKSEQPMTIFIPTSRRVTADKLLELMYHEIEGHARQSMNGLKYKIGGGTLRIDEETLYEGLAKRLDERFQKEFMGVETGKPGPFYTLAIDSAEKGNSFYQIFSEQVSYQLHVLLKIFPDVELDFSSPEVQAKLDEAMKRAWTTTYRVMRGHTDTTNAAGYAFSKDLAYLRGWLLDRELKAKGVEHYNEAAVLQTNALPLLGRVALQNSDLDHPFQDATKEYCFEVLLPKLESTLDVSE